jgi:hypothetical protein
MLYVIQKTGEKQINTRWGKYMRKYMNDLINIKTKNQRTGFPPVRI